MQDPAAGAAIHGINGVAHQICKNLPKFTIEAEYFMLVRQGAHNLYVRIAQSSLKEGQDRFHQAVDPGVVGPGGLPMKTQRVFGNFRHSLRSRLPSRAQRGEEKTYREHSLIRFLLLLLFRVLRMRSSILLPHHRSYSPMLSLTAIAISCSDPRYRSVVWIEECPSRNLICSRSPPALRQSLAQVRRRS